MVPSGVSRLFITKVFIMKLIPILLTAICCTCVSFAQKDSTKDEEFYHFLATPIDTAKAVPASMKEIVHPSGMHVIDFAYGKGDSAKKGNTCYVHLIGSHMSGKFFMTQFFGKKVFSFVLGTGEVIEGLDIAISEMRQGGRRRIIVPSELGYGKKGNTAAGIGGGETVIFDIELVKVEHN
jgi:FKBP-type peptidyl-prolyl cis-trans isomerase